MRAMLVKLAELRPEDDALGSLAREIIAGRAVLRDAVADSWTGAALADGFVTAQDAHAELSAEQRAAFARQGSAIAHEEPATGDRARGAR